jgi:plasmid stabilization system protein ParE
MKAIWSPRAEAELEDITVYIRVKDGRPETARRIATEINSAVNARALGRYPGLTHPDAPEGWYYFRHKRWLVFYRDHAEGTEVMRIIDATRDLPRHLT